MVESRSMLDKIRKPRNARETVVAFAVVGLALFGTKAGSSVLSEREFDKKEAQQFVDSHGYDDPKLVNTDRFFLWFRGCPPRQNLKYDFEARLKETGDIEEVTVCDNLFRNAVLKPSGVVLEGSE